MTSFGINGSQSMQAITNHVNRFVTLVASLPAVTGNIAVDAYLFSLDIQRNQRAFAITRQFRRINSMQNIVTKKTGLEEMMKNVYQEVYLLEKGKLTSEFA